MKNNKTELTVAQRDKLLQGMGLRMELVCLDRGQQKLKTWSIWQEGKPSIWKAEIITISGRLLVQTFTMGHGLRSPCGLYPRKPSMCNILYSALSDADCAGSSFEDFCGNVGYETDSRKALDIYLECQEMGSKLKRSGIPLDAVREILEGY